MEKDNSNLKIIKEYIEVLSRQIPVARNRLVQGAADFETKRANRLKEMASNLEKKLGKDHPDVLKLREEASSAQALSRSFRKDYKPKDK